MITALRVKCNARSIMRLASNKEGLVNDYCAICLEQTERDWRQKKKTEQYLQIEPRKEITAREQNLEKYQG